MIVGLVLFNNFFGFDKLSWNEEYSDFKLEYVSQTNIKLGINFENEERVKDIKYDVTCGEAQNNGLEVNWDLSESTGQCKITASYKLRKISKKFKIINFNTSEQVQKGQVLAKPNSIVAATKFDADVHILSKEEGGRHTPFFDGYRPQFYFRATDITGVIDLPDNIVMVNPGENVSFTTTLVSNVAMEVGTEFSIREGGLTVGKGTVTKVY